MVGDRCVNAFPDDKCKNWRDLGDCVANKAWMTQNCKQACGTCGEGTPGSKLLVYLLHKNHVMISLPYFHFVILFELEQLDVRTDNLTRNVMVGQ